MVEIVSIGPKPKEDMYEMVVAAARKAMPDAAGVILVTFAEAANGDNGSFAMFQMNTDIKEQSLAAVRLMHLANRYLDEL